MTGQVIALRPLQKMDAALFDRLVEEIMSKYLRQRGFNPEFQTATLERARNAAKPLRNWFDALSLNLPGDLTQQQLDAITEALGHLISKMQRDVLGALLVEVFLCASAVQQAKDHGLEVVPIKDL